MQDGRKGQWVVVLGRDKEPIPSAQSAGPNWTVRMESALGVRSHAGLGASARDPPAAAAPGKPCPPWLSPVPAGLGSQRVLDRGSPRGSPGRHKAICSEVLRST